MEIRKRKEVYTKVAGLVESLLGFMLDLMEKYINKEVIHCVVEGIEIE